GRRRHGARQPAVRVDYFAGAHEGGGDQRGRGGVRVGAHGGGVVVDPARPFVFLHAERQLGGLVEEFLDVPAEPPVVQAQRAPQARVEAAGGEGGPDVGLVVVVHQGQRGGPVHADV